MIFAHGRDKLARRANRQKSVQPFAQKYSAVLVGQIRFRTPAILSHQGALAIVANEGQGAVDVRQRLTSAALAYGEIVWVRRPGAGVK